MANVTTSRNDHATAPPFLSASGLAKRYGGVIAVKHADVDLYPGEVHALLGENGAGKSTLVNILAGNVQPGDPIVFTADNVDDLLENFRTDNKLGVLAVRPVGTPPLDRRTHCFATPTTPSPTATNRSSSASHGSRGTDTTASN